MNSSILEHRRQFESLQTKKARENQVINKFVGITTGIISAVLVTVYILHFLGIVHLSI